MATIFDVAKLAEVSIKTVSRVLNDEPSVRAATRERVKDAMAKLSYRPHSGARLMRSSKSRLVGMITSAISSTPDLPYQAGLSAIHIVKGVQAACRAAGKTLMIADSGDDPNEVEELIGTFIAHRVEGVIFASDYHRQVVLPLRPDTPLVLANCFDEHGTPAVVPDDVFGQELAVQHLVERGHRRIGYVGLPDELVAGRQRRESFRHTCKKAGLAESDTPFRVGTEPPPKAGHAPLEPALIELLSLKKRPTAICFGNDLMAMRAQGILDRMGLRVPADLSIVGYDNDTAITEAMSPRLSTVTLPYSAMGQAAVDALAARTDDGRSDPPADPRHIRGSFVARDSVDTIGAAPRDAA